MKNTLVKTALYLNYFVFAILLNSVGVVILKMQQNFDVTKSSASVLEGFKDLPIAICSFIIASFLPRLGIKKAMLIGLALVAIICFITTQANSFWFFKLLFIVIGLSFALVKISVFTTIGIIAKSDKDHASTMGFLEGFFMIGVLVGNVLFSLFMDDNDIASLYWLNVYWILGTLSLISFLFLYFTSIDEQVIKTSTNSVKQELNASTQLFKNKKVIVFLACAFFFVLVEQSFQTWTPTFYKDVLKMSTTMSIQAGAILAFSFAVGRFLSGFIARYMKWIYVVVGCIVCFSLSIIGVLPMVKSMDINEVTDWFSAPIVVYLFPLMGIFLSPIYPSINSVILVSIPKYLHSAMAGLIIVFSAIGGTLGSMITGVVFQNFSGTEAFYFSLIPLTFLLTAVVYMNSIKSTLK